jgi:hypothetical protein
METPRPGSVNVLESTFDDVLARAMRARDALAGAGTLIGHESALAELIATARVAIADIVDTLEQSLAVDAERKRIHGAQAFKLVAPAVSR